ncbi:MAG: ribonuclease P protein component 2 [Candidatus Aenigmarchaeota archaeon]|nr:ribonuclease P protein component 2 [Candidatus Aenigmarchaeota archaeon]
MDEEKRPKPLPPSLRGRRRYLAFHIISEEKVLLQDVINTIWHSLLNFLGETGTSRANIRIIKDTYDEKRQMGILRCSHDSVEGVRTALALIQRIGDTRVVFRVLGISGSIKATKIKFFGESRLTEFTR